MNELLCQIGWYYKKLAIIGNTNFFGLFEKLGGEAHLKNFIDKKKKWGVVCIKRIWRRTKWNENTMLSQPSFKNSKKGAKNETFFSIHLLVFRNIFSGFETRMFSHFQS